MMCANHPTLPATAVVTSPSAVRPYTAETPLCEGCAELIRKIAPGWKQVPYDHA